MSPTFLVIVLPKQYKDGERPGWVAEKMRRDKVAIENQAIVNQMVTRISELRAQISASK